MRRVVYASRTVTCRQTLEGSEAAMPPGWGPEADTNSNRFITDDHALPHFLAKPGLSLLDWFPTR
jgi:hypothetical protein